VLETHDRVDLERLQQFADSMSDSPTSQPAYRLSKLASVFVSVATVYIKAREQNAHNEHIEPQKSTPVTAPDYTSAELYQHPLTYSMPAWAPINPLLHALGFSEDQSLNIDGASDENANLENWFNGNQHIMGLLEDDLSYLDSPDLTF
jgi:hypothetical protein